MRLRFSNRVGQSTVLADPGFRRASKLRRLHPLATPSIHRLGFNSQLQYDRSS
jgi:hypothetical protein